MGLLDGMPNIYIMSYFVQTL